MNERRASYRVSDGLEGIQLSIRWSGHESIAARLVDLSAQGASVQLAVPISERSGLSIGSSILVSFDIPGVAPLKDVHAVVHHVSEVRGEQLVGLEIEDLTRLQNSLPRRLFALFNRRRDFRVEVPQVPPIEVEVTRDEGDSPLVAHLADISVGGCGVLLNPAHVPAVGDEVRLSFRLPDTPHQYLLEGTVRVIREFAKLMRCGIEFQVADAKQLVLHQKRIAQYVMQRQREDLRTK